MPDFCAFILTHGRPGRVDTYSTLRKQGYTGPIRLIVDDADKTLPQYRERYGSEVVTFSREDVAGTFDIGDNLLDTRGVVYARNANFQIAKGLGFRAFVQLDDDYTGFEYTFNNKGEYAYKRIEDLDTVFQALLDYLEATPFLSVAMSQGGDHIGGGGAPNKRTINGLRKAMNSFVCLTERPFQFFGRVNEDVNAYVTLQRQGGAFLTFQTLKLVQRTTQSNPGGMTTLYLESGTYVKSFYSVMYAPSCVAVAQIKSHTLEYEGHARIHHRVNWDRCAPKIIPEHYKKTA